MHKLKKRGQVFNQFGGLAIGLATFAIVMVVAFLIIAEGKEQIGDIEGIDETNSTQCQTSSACNATTELQGAMEDVPGWTPLIVIAVIGGILIGLVSMYRRKQ